MQEPDDERRGPLPHFPFERIRHTTDAGDAYWSARELMEVLGYAKWQRFREAIQRAVTACATSGQEPADHFTGVGKMITIGKGGRRTVEDFHFFSSPL